MTDDGGAHRVAASTTSNWPCPRVPRPRPGPRPSTPASWGCPRVPKPPELASRGGCWFELGPAKVHLGVEQGFRPARKAHPALVVADLDAPLRRSSAPATRTRRTEDVPGRPQWYVDDPFGNRIELVPQ